MVIDLRHRQEVTHFPSGLTGEISWMRLIGLMRTTGELLDEETVSHIELTKDRLRFLIEPQR